MLFADVQPQVPTAISVVIADMALLVSDLIVNLFHVSRHLVFRNQHLSTLGTGRSGDQVFRFSSTIGPLQMIFQVFNCSSTMWAWLTFFKIFVIDLDMSLQVARHSRPKITLVTRFLRNSMALPHVVNQKLVHIFSTSFTSSSLFASVGRLVNAMHLHAV